MTEMLARYRSPSSRLMHWQATPSARSSLQRCGGGWRQLWRALGCRRQPGAWAEGQVPPAPPSAAPACASALPAPPPSAPVQGAAQQQCISLHKWAAAAAKALRCTEKAEGHSCRRLLLSQHASWTCIIEEVVCMEFSRRSFRPPPPRIRCRWCSPNHHGMPGSASACGLRGLGLHS